MQHYICGWRKDMYMYSQNAQIAAGLPQAYCLGHQSDIRMRLHRLLRPDDNKSAASCQQD